MVERIRDDRILRPQKGLEQSGIGVETAGIKDRILEAEKPGNPRF